MLTTRSEPPLFLFAYVCRSKHFRMGSGNTKYEYFILICGHPLQSNVILNFCQYGLLRGMQNLISVPGNSYNIYFDSFSHCRNYRKYQRSWIIGIQQSSLLGRAA